MFRRTLTQVYREQATEFIEHTDLSAAPDATPQLQDGNMPFTVVADLLAFLENREIEESELAVYKVDDEGMSLATFFSIFFGNEGQEARLNRTTLGWDAIQGLQVGEITRIVAAEALPIAEPSLVLPDSEASEVALAGETPFGRFIVPSKYDNVKKQSQGWRKSWQSRHLFVDAVSGFGYYSKPVPAQERNNPKRSPKLSLVLGDVLSVRTGESEDTSKEEGQKKKRMKKLKPGLFQVKVSTGRTYTFAAENDTAAQQWCSTISSHVVIHAIKNNLGIDRVIQFINSGGNVDATDGNNKQYPLLALALSNGAHDIAEYLIQQGADPSCLLRWSFQMVDKITPASQVLDLLMELDHDLNICGDDQHRWNLLHYLCLEGNFERIEILLSKISDTTIQSLNTIGDSPLSLLLKATPESVSEAVASKIAMLLCPHSDANQLDSDGDSILHLAVKRGFVELVHRLVQQGANVNAKDSNGDTALHLAIKLRNTDAANAILENATDLEIDIRDKANKDTAFVLTIKLGLEDMACKLLEQGASVNSWSGRWGDSSCREDQAIHMVIKTGLRKLALKCLDFKCDVTTPDSQGRTVLHLALLHNMFYFAVKVADQYPQPERGIDYERSEIVLEGSPVNICDTGYGESPLMMAFGMRELEVACAILDAGAKLNLCNLKRESPIHRAIQLCSAEYFSANSCRISQSKALLESMLGTGDADAYLACEPDHKTPFHIIATHENEASVLGAAEALLAHNPELPNARDACGDSILISAIKHENYQVAHLVVSGGCNLDIVNSIGDSALHVAVKKGATDLLRSMLQHGAYAGIWDRHGNCPLHNAIAAGNVDMIETFSEFCMQEGHLNHRTESGYTAAMVAIASAQVKALKALMRYNVDLRLQLPKTRKGTLHLAVDTCLSDKVPVADRLELIDTLFVVDSTELSVNSFKHNEKTTGIFSASKCYETLEQLHTNLVAELEHDTQIKNNSEEVGINANIPLAESLDVEDVAVAQEEEVVQDEFQQELEDETKDGELDVVGDQDHEGEEQDDAKSESSKVEDIHEETKDVSAGPKFGVPIPYGSDWKQTANSNPTLSSKSPLGAKDISGRRRNEFESESPFGKSQLAKKVRPNTEIVHEDESDNTDDDEQQHDEDAHSMVFLKNLSLDDRERILSQIRDEARGTAEEWLSTNAGERMMQRRARELVKVASERKEKLSHEEALEQARETFIESHIEESVQGVQDITEGVAPGISEQPMHGQFAVSS